jgi:hypothetical protein
MLFLSFLYFTDKKQLKEQSFLFTYPKLLCCIAYALFWGFRGFIGTDYSWYYPYYNNLSENLIDAFSDREFIEPGYVVYMYVFKLLGFDYHFFIFFHTCINVLFFHYIFKNNLKKYYIWGFVIFIAFAANMEFNNLRNIRSILLFFATIPYIAEKRWVPFGLLNLLGLSFHSTTIFYFPFYFILNKNWKNVILPIVIIGFGLIVLKLNVLTTLISMIARLLGGKYESATAIYLSFIEPNGFTMGALVRFAFGLCLWCVYDRIKDSNTRIYANLMICYLFCMSFFNEISVFRLRFSMMFAISLCVMIPSIYKMFSLKSNKNIYLTFAILAALSQALVNFQGPLFKYDNVIFGIQSYQDRVSTFYLL